jgi:GH24 family phage-related lysozyme (muramidase)
MGGIVKSTKYYTIDAAGVELIAGFEGYVDGVYDDSDGYATVGFGHLLHESAATPADHREYDGRGKEFFTGLLHEDIHKIAILPMRFYIHVAMDQNRVNALASLGYNAGGGVFAGSMGRFCNAKDWAAAADEFIAWAHPSVLLGRRETERTLFLKQ